jgi:hypothetical protein
MIRKIFSVITAVLLLALGAMGESQRNSVAAQSMSSTLSSPRVVLDITDIQMLTGNSARIAWTTQRNGAITLDKYTITLVLTRNGKTERVVTTAAGAATSATVDLKSLSTDSLTTLFGPNLKATATLRADFSARTPMGWMKSFTEVKESKTFTSVPK